MHILRGVSVSGYASQSHVDEVSPYTNASSHCLQSVWGRSAMRAKARVSTQTRTTSETCDHLCNLTPAATGIAHCLQSLLLLSSPGSIGATLLLGCRLHWWLHGAGVGLDRTPRRGHRSGHHRGWARVGGRRPLARRGVRLLLWMMLLVLCVLLVLLVWLLLLLRRDRRGRNRNAFKGRDTVERMNLLLLREQMWMCRSASRGRRFDPLGSRRGAVRQRKSPGLAKRRRLRYEIKATDSNVKSSQQNRRSQIAKAMVSLPLEDHRRGLTTW